MTAAASMRVALRMRDVALALSSANVHDYALGKLQLQKFIYLLDALSVLFRVMPPREAHRTYKRGPWDPAIQDAVDCLAFRGLVQIERVQQLNSGEVAASYALTKPGVHWVAQLRKSGRFDERFRAVEEIAACVSRLGWDRLKELVYAEPTYVARREEGFGQELAPAEQFDASTRALVEVIKRALESGWHEFEVDERLIVNVFFRFLDVYSSRSRRKGAAWT